MKKLLCIMLAFAMIAALAACGSSAKTVDPAELADALLNGLTWQSAMTEESEDILKIALALPDDAEAVGYQSDGTTPEMVICVRSGDTDAVQEGVQSYLDETETQMSQYFPDQVGLVQDAIVTVCGDVVIVCVNADTAAAQSIIDSYTK